MCVVKLCEDGIILSGETCCGYTNPDFQYLVSRDERIDLISFSSDFVANLGNIKVQLRISESYSEEEIKYVLEVV